MPSMLPLPPNAAGLRSSQLGGEESDLDRSAKDYLDGVIERRLLPLLQADAVDGVVLSLESPLAFEPPMTTTTLASHLLPDVTFACSTLLDKTAPLFEALHRLSPDGEIFGAVLAVLEHTVLTFVSRAKQRSEDIISGLTSWKYLGSDIDDSARNPFSSR